MKPLGIKIIFTIIFFAEALIMGVLPVYLKAFRDSADTLSIANAFSGGVFLSICLMHIMPE